MKAGLYLHLFHGRDTADEVLEDWGFQGPHIGPLKYVHTTYRDDIKFQFESPEDFQKFFPWKRKFAGCRYHGNLVKRYSSDAEIEDAARAGVVEAIYQTDAALYTSDDMLIYDGKFYGDWSVYYREADPEDDPKLEQVWSKEYTNPFEAIREIAQAAGISESLITDIVCTSMFWDVITPEGYMKDLLQVIADKTYIVCQIQPNGKYQAHLGGLA